MKRIAITLALGLLTFACSKAPETPTFKGKGEGSGTGDDNSDNLTPQQKAEQEQKKKEEEQLNLALDKEFALFTKAADEVDLKSAENLGKIPALAVKSQMAISDILAAAKQEEKESPKGRCLVFVSGDKALSEKDLVSKDILLSAGGKFLYTESSELEPSDCQKVFKEKLAERYKTDFFQLHEVFYSIR